MAHSTFNRIRTAFTLIELLVVMTIIAILVALIVPAVMSAYRRAESFAIEQEITQLSAAIDSFKTKYGFYPPDFSGITSANDFIPYLNRIAPNHNESSANIIAWYNNVGMNLGPGSAYIFWLSGLSKNKQYPLTDGSGVPLKPFNTDQNIANVAVLNQEKEVFFDFKSNRMVFSGYIPTYMQAANSSNELVVYFELARLAPVATIGPFTIGGQQVAPYRYYDTNLSANTYFNKESFQFITPGIDGQFGITVFPPMIANATPKERDNLANFSEGRLERLILQ